MGKGGKGEGAKDEGRERENGSLPLPIYKAID